MVRLTLGGVEDDLFLHGLLCSAWARGQRARAPPPSLPRFLPPLESGLSEKPIKLSPPPPRLDIFSLSLSLLLSFFLFPLSSTLLGSRSFVLLPFFCRSFFFPCFLILISFFVLFCFVLFLVCLSLCSVFPVFPFFSLVPYFLFSAMFSLSLSVSASVCPCRFIVCAFRCPARLR